MKKILLFTLVAGSVFAAQAQAVSGPVPASQVSPTPSVLNLKETSHNFGKIPQGRPATYNFEFTNTGTEPLVLENVHASCGCTTPEWPKEPIAPGAAAAIKVGYNAHAEGAFVKTVTISYLGGQTKTLTISGDVYKTAAGPAPDNASIQFLKQTNQ